jgi:succinyl-CoA synthetase beta subunit
VKVHEYQAKDVLARFGVPVPRGKVAETAEAAVSAAREIGGNEWVVKAQVHAGGRGKAGGVKLCRSLDEVRQAAGRIIGMLLVSPQTGPQGRIVRKALVTEACEIAKEFYAAVVLDRRTRSPVLMVSPDGGVEIEEVAAQHPERIHLAAFDPWGGLRPYQGRQLARRLGVTGATVPSLAGLLVDLSRAFVQTDASLAEINPLVLTRAGACVALDAKFSFDDNALFRHPELRSLRDLEEEEPLEVRASEHDLSYIKLDGDIGCMVNGAGLAMATLDIIQHFGGEPANFLDVGGGATAERVTEAFKIILEDTRVRAILVNIFGGIMKCDVIAEGILAAARSIELRVPVVVRLEGTNVERGKELLQQSKLNLIAANDLADAATKVVAQARGGRRP